MSEPFSRKRNLGAISFGRECPPEENSAGWKLQGYMGVERVRLLKLAVAGCVLPDGLILVGQTHGGYERITKDAFREEDIEYYELQVR